MGRNDAWVRCAVAGLTLVALLGTLGGSASAASYRHISATGPIEAIDVGDELSCQVAYVNDSDLEFFPPDTTPGDCGTFLAVGGTLYAPAFSSHGISATGDLGFYIPFTPVSQTGVQGSGSAADPYRVTTVVDAGISGLRLTETTSYVSGSNSYRVETAVANLGGGAPNAILYHAGDCYASGSDIGFGFTRTEISTAGCSQTAQNSPAGRTIQMAPLSAGSQYYEARYDQVWEQIGTLTGFPNTCRCGEHIDNGVGLSWALSFGPGTSSTRSLSVSFTEETPPPAGLDSDGDALPDQWETGGGASGDYENLAPLGASPNRKDVFVHLDYMEGCKPPAGWERNAIRAFAEHGVALHVDSGPDSINADGQAWGSRSRAGAVAYRDDIALWGDFDRLKDSNFVPSNRRRAFHYALIVNKFDNGDGGQARGIPEADLVLSGCNVPGWVKLHKARYLSAAFVHELGHNLGLRHGGGDDYNGKPNYYGIMNYYWALFGGIGGKDGKPGSLPDYSRTVRPEIEEERVDERVPQILPVAWNCPDANDALDVSYEFGSEPRLIDWDCDGVYGEGPRKLNLNSTWNDYLGGPKETVLRGFNDWRPGVMQFSAAGVLGDFDVPERPNPPVGRELTTAEVNAVHRELTRNRRQARRQLVVSASRRRLRAGRPATLRISVEPGAGKARLRGVKLQLRGASLLSRQRLRTGRRGSVLLRLVPKRRQVKIFARKRGFTRGGLLIPVHGKARCGKCR
jgi:hypothetical protein